MIPFADVHCHLCAGLDDGPRTLDEAIDMCRIASQSGTRFIAAVAHQNRHWPKSNRASILQACQQLNTHLHEQRIKIALFPTGEVMIDEDLFDQLDRGELVTVADQGTYLLIELPSGTYIDLRQILQELVGRRIHPILAHPERHAEILHSSGEIEEIIRCGGLVQVNAGSILMASEGDRQTLRSWFRRGVVHLVGSDGHRTDQRRPILADAYARVVQWAGIDVADRVFYTNGISVLQGTPLRSALPRRKRKRFWFF